MAETEILATWDDAAISSSFVAFKEGERKTYAIRNWRNVKVRKPDFDDKNVLTDQVEFRADVVGINGKLAKEKIASTSKRFIAAVRPHLEKAKEGSIVFLSIKRIGKDSATNFDVELAQPSELVA